MHGVGRGLHGEDPDRWGVVAARYLGLKSDPEYYLQRGREARPLRRRPPDGRLCRCRPGALRPLLRPRGAVSFPFERVSFRRGVSVAAESAFRGCMPCGCIDGCGIPGAAGDRRTDGKITGGYLSGAACALCCGRGSVDPREVIDVEHVALASDHEVAVGARGARQYDRVASRRLGPAS